MTARLFSESYPVIQSYEQFKELLYQRGQVILKEIEPIYRSRFQTSITLNLEPSLTKKQTNPLLSGRFNRFVDLMESFWEVGYYWKRVTETGRLIEINVPSTPNTQMDMASWFIYNLDAHWHSVYGLQERIIRFLKIFKRMYKTQNNDEVEFIETYIKTIEMLKDEGTKQIRDPLAHFRSQGVQGWRNNHDWEAALMLGDNSDFIEIYDKNYLQHKDFYLDNVRKWVPLHGDTIYVIFDRLSSYSLEKLKV